MSVTSVKPFANLDGGVNEEGVQTYTNVYHVWTNDKNDGSDTARGSAAVSAGLPDYNASWAWGNDSNAFALAKSRRARLVETDPGQPYYKKWEVTIGYTTAGQRRDSSGGGGTGTGAQEGVQNPWAEQWQISGSFVQTTEATSRDKDGKLLKNSAEERLITERPSGYDTLIVSGNTQTISLPTRAAATFKVNKNPIWGLQARQVYLAQWNYDILYRGTTGYVGHRLEFWIERAGKFWNFDRIDMGTRELVDNTSNDPSVRYRPIMVRDLPAEVPLDGAGLVLDLILNPNGVTMTDKVIDEYDFLTNLTFLTATLPGPFA